jgi:CheY-like chemotaxis protein
MAGELIVIVDDNPLNLKMVEYLLTSSGYQVKTATNATEAMNILASCEPSLILMDIQLPGMDGIELTSLLKSEKKYTNTPIIAITAFAMKGDKEKALVAGFDGYVVKPIDISTLPDLLAGYIKSKQKT